MKLTRVLATTLALCSAALSFSATPVYLDESKTLEERVEDALSRMTLEEKIGIIHAQSKFSAPGCLDLEYLRFGVQMALWEFVRKCCGMNGSRLNGPTIPARHSPLSHALQPHGTPKWRLFMAKASARRPVSATKP